MLDMQFFLHAHQKGNKLYFSILNFTKKITQINFCANFDFLISFFKGSRCYQRFHSMKGELI